MSAWPRSMSSTRKISEHRNPACNLPDTGEAATAAEAAIEAAEAAAAEVAAAASGFGGEVAEAVEAAEAVTAGYGPAGAGFGLANESASESKNIRHALELRSSSREASGAAPGADRA